eukprot:9287286-Karenia_brevis.AAC.1
MLTHQEWATSIADADQYNYDSKIAESNPDSDSPINEDTVAGLEEFYERQKTKISERSPRVP